MSAITYPLYQHSRIETRRFSNYQAVVGFFIAKNPERRRMNAREERISEIMDEHNVDHDVAEALFLGEIMQKYHTEDIVVAETMFDLDSEGEEE